MINNSFPFDSVELSQNGREVIILDQALLPNQEKLIHLTMADLITCIVTKKGIFTPS